MSLQPPPPPPPPPPGPAGETRPAARAGQAARRSRDHRAVFISYRRGETSGQAMAIKHRLAQRLGEQRVFMDVDSITPGVDFIDKIQEAIAASAVVLALIGHDWMTRDSSGHVVQEPGDFVHFEVETALQRGLAVIPILVENTPMPTAEELPPSLQPLLRREALELENRSWEYDVSRLISAIEPLLSGEERRDGVAARRFPTRALYAAGAAAVALGVLLVVLLLVVLKPSPPPTPPVQHITAAAAVGSVPSDALVESLIKNGFTAADVPANTTANNPSLNTLRVSGLTGTVTVSMSGPAHFVFVTYYVFANVGEASSAYATFRPASPSFSPTAGFGSPAVLGDPSKCSASESAASGTASAAWEWSCLVQSDKAVTFTSVQNFSQTAAEAQLETALTVDAIRHLRSVATAAPRTAPPAPPGALAATALYDQLASSAFDPAITPSGLTVSGSMTQNNESSPPAGLEAGRYLQQNFTGPDASDFVRFWVFDTPQDAQSWFAMGLQPIPATKTGSIDSSGFTQSAQCGTYAIAATSTANAEGVTACYVQDGDVVIESRTYSTVNPQGGNNDLAVTLARAGIIYLDERDAG